jgi:hypothetical protein
MALIRSLAVKLKEPGECRFFWVPDEPKKGVNQTSEIVPLLFLTDFQPLVDCQTPLSQTQDTLTQSLPPSAVSSPHPCPELI